MANTLFPADSEEFRESLDKIHREIVRLVPENADAVREAADYFRLSRRLPEAIAILQAHTKAYPASLAMRTRLGILLLAGQKITEGEAELLAVVAIDPDLPLPHETLAKAFDRRGEKPLARHHRSELLRVSGGSPHQHLALADEFLADGQNRAARLVLEKAAFAYPQNPLIAAKLAVATARDPDAAAAAPGLFRQAEALAKAKNQPEVLDAAFLEAYGQALGAAGQQPAAEDQLRAAIRSFPPDQPKELAAALRKLALLWLDANKNYAAAVSLLQRAEQLDPGNPETQELLRRVQPQ
jgi:predicted Zn-dependent protease